ncbi:ribosomal protection-like ABC-F family protein [Pontibacillus salicampi]|uniref:Ribosomal protection-like ABC-F family protein n=1 Tax=Pontibacillus salicampi TaxID=1449801 RepID=A0ABV6LHU4_9BACI
MRILHAHNIDYSIGERNVLSIKELSIHSGNRIGLVGKNGIGKSLLLHYLLGKTEETPAVQWNGSVHYFSQLDDIQSAEWNKQSGGEKTLRKLQHIFQEPADLLLLDEPTNNLDWHQIELLEQKLLQQKAAFVIVSHDRALLDTVCSTIWELDEGDVHVYNGNYSYYQEAKALQVRQQHEAFEAYTKEKKRLTERMRQKEQQAKGMNKPPARMGSSEWQLHKGKASGKKQKVERVTKVIQERIDRLDKVEKPFEWDKVTMGARNSSPIHRKHVLFAKEISKTLEGSPLYLIPSLKLKTGSKTALLGKNGSGKSTLLHQLLNERQDNWSAQATIGHFEQTLEALPAEESILQFTQANSTLPQHEIRIILGRLHFKEEEVHKPIGVLSGGERVKAALARLLTGDYNVLVLDEPTNHLDVEAIAALESLVVAYPGTILFVSHDRRFVSKTANHLWMLEKQQVTSYAGSLSSYQEYMDRDKAVSPLTEDKMRLENKLTELIGRLSAPEPKENIEDLEKQYAETLATLRSLS